MPLVCRKAAIIHLKYQSIQRSNLFLDCRKKYLCEFKRTGLSFHVSHVGEFQALISISSAVAPRRAVNPTPILCPQNCPTPFLQIWPWKYCDKLLFKTILSILLPWHVAFKIIGILAWEVALNTVKKLFSTMGDHMFVEHCAFYVLKGFWWKGMWQHRFAVLSEL